MTPPLLLPIRQSMLSPFAQAALHASQSQQQLASNANNTGPPAQLSARRSSLSPNELPPAALSVSNSVVLHDAGNSRPGTPDYYMALQGYSGAPQQQQQAYNSNGAMQQQQQYQQLQGYNNNGAMPMPSQQQQAAYQLNLGVGNTPPRSPRVIMPSSASSINPVRISTPYLLMPGMPSAANQQQQQQPNHLRHPSTAHLQASSSSSSSYAHLLSMPPAIRTSVAASMAGPVSGGNGSPMSGSPNSSPHARLLQHSRSAAAASSTGLSVSRSWNPAAAAKAARSSMVSTPGLGVPLSRSNHHHH